MSLARSYAPRSERRFDALQFPLTELYEVSSPLLLSASELAGQRPADEKSCEGNLSEPANRSSPWSSLLLPNESPCALENPVSGHRDCVAAPLDADPARDSKSPPERDAAPVRSLAAPGASSGSPPPGMSQKTVGVLVLVGVLVGVCDGVPDGVAISVGVWVALVQLPSQKPVPMAV